MRDTSSNNMSVYPAKCISQDQTINSYVQMLCFSEENDEMKMTHLRWLGTLLGSTQQN